MLAIKHAPDHVHLQPESKDSFKFLESGSVASILVGRKEMMLSKKISRPDDVFDFLDHFHEKPDYVLMEGLYRDGIPVIEVCGSSGSSELRQPEKNLAAIVCGEKGDLKVPCFHPDDIHQLAAFMEDYHE